MPWDIESRSWSGPLPRPSPDAVCRVCGAPGRIAALRTEHHPLFSPGYLEAMRKDLPPAYFVCSLCASTAAGGYGASGHYDPGIKSVLATICHAVNLLQHKLDHVIKTLETLEAKETE